MGNLRQLIDIRVCIELGSGSASGSSRRIDVWRRVHFKVPSKGPANRVFETHSLLFTAKMDKELLKWGIENSDPEKLKSSDFDPSKIVTKLSS